MSSPAKELIRQHFRWVDGHANIWPILADPKAFAAVIDALAAPLQPLNITAVCGIEARGFVLGSAVALQLGVGFIPLRKAGALHPGPKLTHKTSPDYRGKQHELQLQQSLLRPGDRVALVDDWVETGSQLATASALITQTGAHLVACSVIVNQLAEPLDEQLPQINSLFINDELPPPADCPICELRSALPE